MRVGITAHLIVYMYEGARLYGAVYCLCSCSRGLQLQHTLHLDAALTVPVTAHRVAPLHQSSVNKYYYQ